LQDIIPEKQISISPKEEDKHISNKKSNKFKEWFFKKTYQYSKFRKEDFLIHLTIIVVLSVLFWSIYSNINFFNNMSLWIIKLGSLAELILLILILWYLYKLLVDLRYGIRGLANGFKFILVIGVLLFCFLFYQNPTIMKPITKFDITSLNPFDIKFENLSLNIPSGESILSLYEIKDHPNRYLGKMIVVEGYFEKNELFPYPEVIFPIKPTTEHEYLEALQYALPITYRSTNIRLIQGGKYRFKGILFEHENEIFLTVHEVQLT